MTWKDYLTPDERQQLANIEETKLHGQRERHRIYDRCRKRLAAAKENSLPHEGMTSL
jgi:hypothetical protein